MRPLPPSYRLTARLHSLTRVTESAEKNVLFAFHGEVEKQKSIGPSGRIAAHLWPANAIAWKYCKALRY
jgi:hypothetical protein